MTDALDTVDIRRLITPQIRAIVSVLGLADSLKVFRRYGGTRRRVPAGKDPLMFPELLGEDKARNLARLFSGREYVEINKADNILLELRDMEIRADAEASQVDLALRYDLTVRQIRNIQRADRGDRYRDVLDARQRRSLQGDLFAGAKR